MPEALTPLAISAHAFADERECVNACLLALGPFREKRAGVSARARALIEPIRGHAGGIEAFLQTYGLETREGVAVMCLAEALLRIPDAATIDKLIHATFESTDWERHLGGNHSLFVNASRWGLLLTGALVHLGDLQGEQPLPLLGRLVARVGEPVIREALKAAMRFIGSQFVLGETIEDAVQASHDLMHRGFRFSYDMLGEGARSGEQADAYLKAYHQAIDAIAAQAKGKTLQEAPSISVKLSALHPRYQLTKEARLIEELLPRLQSLALHAMQAGIAISIDAEESSRLDIELELFERLFHDTAFAKYEGIGFVLQAYQKRALKLVDYLAQLSRSTKKRMPLRLVKGAYWDTEIKQAQMLGLPSYPVFTRKAHTDVSYLACARKILEQGPCFYPQFATHNALTAAMILEMAGNRRDFEFQRLHGMGEALHGRLIEHIPCRIYAPVGRHKDLLAYLIRRLLENGANSSFVHLLTDKETPLEDLLEDPITLAMEQPLGGIADPVHLYGDRRNSAGVDMGNRAMLQTVLRGRVCGQEPVADMATEQLTRAIAAARAAAPAWQATSVEARAQMLERMADRLETCRGEALALLAYEGKKTVADAIAEVREAADFCRYYAQQARLLMQERTLTGPTGEYNTLSLHPRGVFACISPWNFPLAIFTGQVAAALVTGNCVLAKPAEQTPRCAVFAVRLLHEAGVPKDVVQCVPGRGETVGAALIQHADINGAVFTGSLDTAQRINRALAARSGAIVPLIAETGGLNAMIVDSSALLEQAVDDIMLSAFGSAGQRCSALRVLYVQEDIADDLIRLIGGAMRELTLGDPADLATDIGPVIDAESRDGLLAHIDRMKRSGGLLATSMLTAEQAKANHFVAPHCFEIKSIGELPGEVFGPVLHVIRFKAADLETIYADINAAGYGLTFGLHSRISERAEAVKRCMHVGNIYVNRSMIGATVGVQPFGGEGLSGTGPKAGGPYYLLRFLTERAVAVNSAAVGGNLELLSQP